MEYLNEVYFGKESIKDFQNQFSKVRAKLRNKPVTSTTNQDPEILKFNRVAENTFGFRSFALYIQPDNSYNAGAYPIDNFYTEEEKKELLKNLISNPTGFKYKKVFPGVCFVMTINSGLFNSEDFSDEELIAVTLHEVGHSFFEAVMNKDSNYTSARRLNGLISKVNDLIKDKIKSGKAVTIDIINTELNKFNSAITSVRRNLTKLLPKFFKESMEDNMKRSRFDYTNEKFADTFAAMFGYSDELHTCLTKITNKVYYDYYGIRTYPKFVEYFKAYILYFNDFLAYVTDVQDEHPADLARIKVSIEYLKREVAKEGIDPKTKKELIDQISKLNKLIDDYINFPKDKDAMRVIRLYYTMLYKKFGGDRREQDTDNDALFQGIDDRYDEVKEDSVIEASNYSDTDIFLDVLCASADNYNEGAIDNIKKDILNVTDLWKQWEKSTGSFVKHKWIYRYIDEKQKAALQKHMDVVCAEKPFYSAYKRSFNAICKFIGLPNDSVILENVVFKKDEKDKDQDIIAVKYSKGKVKVTIPDGIQLIHTTPAAGIKELIPSFKSKVAGKYMYPTRRVFFSCIKPIAATQAGLEGKKLVRFTPKERITTAYIDPTYSEFSSNSVYVETERPIPVESFRTFIDKLFHKS